MQGAVAGLVFLAVLVIFAIIVVAKSVALIPQAEAAVIERLGRYSRTVSGQLTLLVPFIDRVRARGPARAGGVVSAATGDHRGQLDAEHRHRRLLPGDRSAGGGVRDQQLHRRGRTAHHHHPAQRCRRDDAGADVDLA